MTINRVKESTANKRKIQ